MGLSSDERISTVPLAVFTQYQRMTDRQTDGRNCHVSIARCVYQWMQTPDNNRQCRLPFQTTERI